MPNRVLGKCPVCAKELTITRLNCPSCSTEIQGNFEPCAYCRLDPEQERLVSVFLKTRGNIREVERELGISYPTVRARLDEVVRALGMPPKKRTGAVRATKGHAARPTEEVPEPEGD
jgi:hypothetical protein